MPGHVVSVDPAGTTISTAPGTFAAIEGAVAAWRRFESGRGTGGSA